MSETDASDNPFSAGAAGSAPAGEELPSVTDLVSKTANLVMEDFVPFLLGGLPLLVLVFVGAFVGIFLVYGGMFLGMVPGLILEDEAVSGIGFFLGLFGGIFLLIGGLTALTAPITASLYRAVWQFLETGEKLTIGSAFSTIGQDLFKVILFQAVLFACVFTGSLFCYLPGLLVAAALAFSAPAIYIHRLSIGSAISLSVGHMQRNPGWHLAFFGLSFLIAMALGYVPLIGAALASTIHPLFVLLAYRAVFGNGELPRGYEV